MPDNDFFTLPFVKGAYHVKRPDLRRDEIKKQGQSWHWWIENKDFVKEIKSHEVTAAVIPGFHNLSEGQDPAPSDFFAAILPVLPDMLGHQDPAMILSFFCDCHRHKVYPPPWIMNELHDRFSRYLSDKLAGSDKRLGEYFGEKGEAARKPFFRNLALSPLMETAMRDIDRFQVWFGLTETTSIDFVVRYLETINNKKKFTHRFDKGVSAIKSAYSLHGKKNPLEEFRKNANNFPPSFADKRNMVRRYPKDVFDRFRVIFSDYL